MSRIQQILRRTADDRNRRHSVRELPPLTPMQVNALQHAARVVWSGIAPDLLRDLPRQECSRDVAIECILDCDRLFTFLRGQRLMTHELEVHVRPVMSLAAMAAVTAAFPHARMGV